jgi:hypothetical protein
MASSLIVVAIVVAAVAGLIAVLLLVRSARQKSLDRSNEEHQLRVADRLQNLDGPPAGTPTPGAQATDPELPADAISLGTVFRRTGESELAYRLRAAHRDSSDLPGHPSPRFTG